MLAQLCKSCWFLYMLSITRTLSVFVEPFKQVWQVTIARVERSFVGVFERQSWCWINAICIFKCFFEWFCFACKSFCHAFQLAKGKWLIYIGVSRKLVKNIWFVAAARRVYAVAREYSLKGTCVVCMAVISFFFFLIQSKMSRNVFVAFLTWICVPFSIAYHHVGCHGCIDLSAITKFIQEGKASDSPKLLTCKK